MYKRLQQLLEGWTTGRDPVATGQRVGRFINKASTKTKSWTSQDNHNINRAYFIAQRIRKRVLNHGKKFIKDMPPKQGKISNSTKLANIIQSAYYDAVNNPDK